MQMITACNQMIRSALFPPYTVAEINLTLQKTFLLNIKYKLFLIKNEFSSIK
jgi:hypothetical protein